jgi:hypothetical protein
MDDDIVEVDTIDGIVRLIKDIPKGETRKLRFSGVEDDAIHQRLDQEGYGVLIYSERDYFNISRLS